MPIYEESQFQNFKTKPLWEDLSALKPQTVSENSGCTLDFEINDPAYTLNFLGADYRIKPGKEFLEPLCPRRALDFQTGIVLLTYLVNSGKGPAPGLSGVEVSPFMLPSGDLFFKGPHELMKAPVAAAYGDSPESLLRVAASLGALPHHPNSFRLKALPFAEIYCYIDPGDDEFPPEVRYNFDSNIHYYLQLDGIFAMVNCLGSLLVSLKGQ
jgi:hypothetical protein